MTTATQTATADRTQADGAPGRCRYPGCASPARDKNPAAPGPRPGYCEQDVPEDRGDGTPVLVRHTAMTAFRRRGQLAGQPGDDRPVTAAVSRAAAIRDDAIAAMSRLGAQLSAALDQLAALGGQLAAAGDLEAAEAQAEAVRAERTAAQLEQARAETATQAVARHAAELDAAEARAAAAQALAATDADTAARQHAEQRARDVDRALHDERQATAARIADEAEAAAAARAERDAAVAAAGQTRADADRAREQDQHRHAAELAATAAQLAAANDTIAALRDQLARAETALDRERAEQHKTVSLLHDLLASRPAAPAATTDRTRAASGTGHQPADTAGDGTSRRRAPR